MIRLTRIPHVHGGFEGRFLLSMLVAGLAVLFPLPVASLATLATGGLYAALRFRRGSFLLAYPMLFLMPLIFGAGIFLREFDWAGRRYRLRASGEIDVLSGQRSR